MKVVKKPHKHDTNLQKNSTLYFQVGLILTLLASYGLFEMNFKSKLVSIPNNQLQDTEVVFFVKVIPEVIPEPVAETKVTPVRKKLLALNIITVDNTSKIIPKKKEPTISIKAPAIVFPNKKPKAVIPVKPRNVLNVEQVPIYPGCEKFITNTERRKCMSKKIGKLIQRKFNTDLGSVLGLSGKQKIDVQFKIDKNGNVSEIKARSLHNKLKNEAIRVVDKIPQMIPGKHKNKNVDVMYSLPIIFKVVH